MNCKTLVFAKYPDQIYTKLKSWAEQGLFQFRELLPLMSPVIGSGSWSPLERERRSPERRDAILLAHGARMVSDVLSTLLMRLAVGYRFVAADPKPVHEAGKAISKLLMELGKVQDVWLDIEYSEVRPA